MQALWVLEEAGRPYKRIVIDVHSDAQNKPGYRAINPMGKVPALEDDGTIVTESAAICAHVADRVPETGLAPPAGAPQRGAWYRWLFFSPGCIEPAYMQKFTGLAVDKKTAAWGSYDLVIDTLEGAVKNGPWVLGERFSGCRCDDRLRHLFRLAVQDRRAAPAIQRLCRTLRSAAGLPAGASD